MSVRRLECLNVCAIFHAGSFTHNVTRICFYLHVLTVVANGIHYQFPLNGVTIIFMAFVAHSFSLSILHTRMHRVLLFFNFSLMHTDSDRPIFHSHRRDHQEGEGSCKNQVHAPRCPRTAREQLGTQTEARTVTQDN